MGTVGSRCLILYYLTQPFRVCTSWWAFSIGQPDYAPLYAAVPPVRGFMYHCII